MSGYGDEGDDEGPSLSGERADGYDCTRPMFSAVQAEIKELAKKKPEATMSQFKVGQINRILKDLLAFLKQEPEAKYLDLLDEDTLPQIGDAVVVMAQFEAALTQFWRRYRITGDYGADYGWRYEE